VFGGTGPRQKKARILFRSHYIGYLGPFTKIKIRKSEKKAAKSVMMLPVRTAVKGR